MRLKTLKIAGFKSFADKVVLDFSDPISAIVGPNGCGKSNIVDAIRWVLGEQSVKSLRGGQMQDVLFSGSATRKALSQATVALTLTDIAPGELPHPYSEITVARSLDREGRSEYTLNGETVRLRDIQDLFLGTGMSHSIFEQGKIDRVIQLTPLARREIFDEAAGIGRFLERKKETVRKLSAMMENYHRLEDLHAEVGKNHRLLKKQATQAEQFLTKKQEIEVLEKSVLVTRFKQLRRAQTQEEEQWQKVVHEIAQQATLLAQEEEKRLKYKQQRSEQEARVGQLREKLSQNERAAAVQENEMTQQQKREEELAKRAQYLVIELKEQRALLEHEEQAYHKAGKNSSTDLPQQEQSVAHLHAQVKEAQQAHVNALHVYNLGTQKLQATQFRLKSMQQTHERLAQEGAQTQQKMEALEFLVKEQSSKVEKLKAAITEQQKALKQGQEEYEILQKEQAALEAQRHTTARQQAECSSAWNVLQALQKQHEGATTSYRQLHEASQQPKHPLYQLLSPLCLWIEPLSAWAPQVDLILAAYRHTFVVKTRRDSETLLAYAHQQKMGDFSIFCLEDLCDEENTAPLAAPSAVASHFLRHIVLGEGEAPCTLRSNGEWKDEKGVYFVPGEHSFSPFSQQAKVQELTLEGERLKAELSRLDQCREARRLDLEKCKNCLQQSSEHQRKQEMFLVQENFSLQKAKEDIKNLQNIFAEKEQQRALLALDEGNAECGRDALALEAQKKECEMLAAHIQTLEAQWQLADQAVKEQRLKAHALHVMETKLAEGRKGYARLEREQNEVLQTQQLSQQMRSERAQQWKEIQALCVENTQKVQEEREILAQLRQAQEGCEQRCQQGQSQLQLLHKRHHALEVKRSEEGIRAQHLTTALWEQFEMTEKIALESPLFLEEVDEAERKAKRLKKELEEAGPINLTAIDSYAQESKRFEELDHQLQDLSHSKQDLEALIAKLDHESRQQFKRTFAQVRESFKKNFQTLFGGGEADLTFTESHDVLEAGIDILAKPPGKQMRTISLLSGGEKCLTALALLFSIFEARPAPFCILDEVDAPLDESNVKRFTGMLNRYIAHTQFLIVTHNKNTMAVAQRLMGVSMEEKGVSKLLSLKFSKQTQETGVVAC